MENSHDSLYTETRPWGYFTVLEDANDYKVKKIVVNSKSRLSLQKHNHRSEQWVVAKGFALVTCGEKHFIVKAGENVFIEKNTIHRIENQTDTQIVVIEVQNGDYLGEDDIIRIEDDYSRK